MVSAKDYDLTDCADDFLRGQTTCLQDHRALACVALAYVPQQRGQALSFQSSSAANDAWGCTMYGVAQFRGVGTGIDNEAAAKSLIRACYLAGDERFETYSAAGQLLTQIGSVRP